MSPNVLILGHGWRAWNSRHQPRCAPMEIDEWNTMVQDAPKDKLTFIDFDCNEEPDIHENVCRKQTRPYVIFLFLFGGRRIIKGVKFALKDNGVYIGWNDSKNLDRKERRLRLPKIEIDTHCMKTYGHLRHHINSW